MNVKRPAAMHAIARRSGLIRAAVRLAPALAVLAAAAPAQGESTEERAARVDSLAAIVARLRTPEAGMAARAAAGPGGRNLTAFDRTAQRKLGGYYDVEFTAGDGIGSGFDLHRLILQASSFLGRRLFFNTEIEFEHGAVIPPEPSADEGELKIEQAWGSIQLAEAASFRGGIILVPLGRLNVLHDSDIRDTTSRPLFTQVIVPSTFFETGVGVQGLAYPTEDWLLDYEVYVVNGLTDEVGDGAGLREARPSLRRDNNNSKALTGRLGLSPSLHLETGVSVYSGATSAEIEDSRVSVVAFDALWKQGPFELMGEGGIVAIADGLEAAGRPKGMNGFYVEGRYHFFPASWRGRLGLFDFDHPTFTLVGRAGTVDTDTGATTAGDRREILIGINYRPIEQAVVKLEGVRYRETATGTERDRLFASIAMGF